MPQDCTSGFVDRLKDSIRRRGENIPEVDVEVEDVLGRRRARVQLPHERGAPA